VFPLLLSRLRSSAPADEIRVPYQHLGPSLLKRHAITRNECGSSAWSVLRRPGTCQGWLPDHRL